MWTKMPIVLAALWGWVTVGQAQVNQGVETPFVPPPVAPVSAGWGGGYPYGGWWQASTAAEGFGRGLAAMITGLGQYNLATSEAAINLSAARRSEIANDKYWTQTYFEMREINRLYHEAKYRRERGNPEDFARYAAMARPKLLSNQQLDTVTGEIRWPILLTLPGFSSQRARLQKAFADRAYHGVMGAEDLLVVRQLTGEMLANLRDRVIDLPPQEYMVARRFIESLAYEASRPIG
ncbi:MAG: hypothetical protein ABFC96_11960 [Thermoguttaceae bacterium]